MTSDLEREKRKPYREDTEELKIKNEINEIFERNLNNHNWHGVCCATCEEMIDDMLAFFKKHQFATQKEMEAKIDDLKSEEKKTLGVPCICGRKCDFLIKNNKIVWHQIYGKSTEVEPLEKALSPALTAEDIEEMKEFIRADQKAQGEKQKNPTPEEEI